MTEAIAATEWVAIEQLTPSEWNPRTVRSKRFRELVRSIERDPAFLEERPILASADGRIYAGEQRYHAAKHLGWERVPARLVAIDELTAKERALRDNAHAGDWQEKKLAEIVAELEIAGVETRELGIEEKALEKMLAASAASLADGGKAEAELEIAPELFERHDYLVFYFDNSMDWQVATEFLGVKKQESGQVSTRTLVRTGIGRVLPAAKLLELIARAES